MLFAVCLCVGLWRGPAPPLETVKLGDGLYLITGSAAGNVLVWTGSDGSLLIDAQDPRNASEARACVQRVAHDPIRFVVNTHFHEDHRGLNAALAQAGAVIVAHDRTRHWMSLTSDVAELKWHRQAAPAAARPTLTFTSSLTLHLNDAVIELVHLPRAHTDGDCVARFQRQNLIHTGDIYEIGAYPFLDIWSGGTIDGLIAAVDRLLAWSNDATRLVPGHGPVSNQRELSAYGDMLKTIRDRVQHAIDEDLGLDALLQSKPTAEFDRTHGGDQAGARLVRIIHQQLSEH